MIRAANAGRRRRQAFQRGTGVCLGRVRRAVAARWAARDDAGAVLILALVFLVVAALALVGLVMFSGGALVNTSNLKKQRGLEYAADSATEIAIQKVRYSTDAFDNPTGTPVLQNCLGQTSVAFSATGFPTTPTQHPTTAGVFKIAVDCQGTGTIYLQSPLAHTVTVSTGSKTITTVTRFGTAAHNFTGYEVVDASTAFPATTFVLSQDVSTGTVTLTKAATASVENDKVLLFPSVERKITLFACSWPGSSSPPPCNSTNYIVHATVWINDVSSTPTIEWLCGTTSTATCGSSMVLRTWVNAFANH